MEKKNFAMSATLAKPIKVKGISNKQIGISSNTQLPKLMSSHLSSMPLQNLTNNQKLISDPRSLEPFVKGKPLLKNSVSTNILKKELPSDSIWQMVDKPKIDVNENELRKTLEQFHNKMNQNMNQINIKQIEENKDKNA